MSDEDRLIEVDGGAGQYQLFGLEENGAAADGVEFLPAEEVA